jgi:hypothetical protein
VFLDKQGAPNIDATKNSIVWVIDLASGKERTLSVPQNTDAVPGRTPRELLLGWPTFRQDRVIQSHVIVLDLSTGKRKTLLTKRGQYDVDGLSDDGKWVLLKHPYAEVGPGELSAVRLSDGKTRVLQDNVYNCVVVRDAP